MVLEKHRGGREAGQTQQTDFPHAPAEAARLLVPQAAQPGVQAQVPAGLQAGSALHPPWGARGPPRSSTSLQGLCASKQNQKAKVSANAVFLNGIYVCLFVLSF